MTSVTRSGHVALVAIVAVISVTAIAVTPVAGQGTTHGEPELNLYLPENEVLPGAVTELSFQLENDGHVRSGTQTEVVTTARAVSVEVIDDGPFDVLSGRTALGTITDGTVSSVDLRMVVPDDVEPGVHEIDVRVRYSVTNRVSEGIRDQRLSRSVTHTVEVTVVDEARFRIDRVTTDVQPGADGEATIAIENIGSQPAFSTRAAISAGSGVTLDGEAANVFLGTLEPGDTERITVDVSVDQTVYGGERPIEAVFDFRDGNGIERQSNPVIGNLTPLSTQSFRIETLEDTLSVGYDGHIRGTLRNEGPRDVSDGVLLLEPASDSLFVEEGRFALPDLPSGDVVDFSFSTAVSGQADPGPRQVRFTVEYANDGRSTVQSDPISERVIVDDRRNEFSITGHETIVAAGESIDFVLTITNERPETLSNVNAKLYTDGPLSSTSDEAFVNELEPGESAEIRFRLSSSPGAMEKAYPVELDFQYDTERGDTVLSRTYQHPVEVVEPIDDGESGIPIGLAIAGLLLLAAIGAGVWWRRRG